MNYHMTSREKQKKGIMRGKRKRVQREVPAGGVKRGK